MDRTSVKRYKESRRAVLPAGNALKTRKTAVIAPLPPQRRPTKITRSSRELLWGNAFYVGVVSDTRRPPLIAAENCGSCVSPVSRTHGASGRFQPSTVTPVSSPGVDAELSLIRKASCEA